MSSIVIAGDTSGSVTLSAPAVAGTPTLTLPTTSGTLALTSGVPSVAGSNTQIQFNNAGALGANASFSFDGTNFVLDGSTKIYVLGSGAKIQMQTPTASANWTFETAGTNLTIASPQSGQFNIYRGSANSTFGVGAADPSASGVGITFPASQSDSSNANTLDDYEEGTWTPTVTLNTGTGTNYTIGTATYTKTGRVVVVIGSIIPTNGTFGSTNGYARMTGLPFTVATRVGTGSGGNSSNLNNGVATTFAYTTTVDVAFTSGVTSTNEFAFTATYFV